MNKRTIIGGLIIVVFLVVGFLAFKDSKIEYASFKYAAENHKKCQVKGAWDKAKDSNFDPNTNQFSFWMKDENNTEVKVVLEGAKPNNFDMAENVVAKGKMLDGYFHADEVLTKCPSKYEGKGSDVNKGS